MRAVSVTPAVARAGFVVQGVELVAGSFLEAAAETPEKLEEKARPIADAIADTQRSMVPKRSMATHDSIEVTMGGESEGGMQTFAEIGPTHFVAQFLEFGTIHMSPRPFVWPSADMHEDDWYRAAGDVAGDV